MPNRNYNAVPINKNFLGYYIIILVIGIITAQMLKLKMEHVKLVGYIPFKVG
jgi:hypothetical protein